MQTVGCRPLNPAYFQVIFDLLDAVELAQSFLRHLLLIVRVDRSVEHNSALLRFEAELAVHEKGALLQSRVDQMIERRRVGHNVLFVCAEEMAGSWVGQQLHRHARRFR